MKSRQKIKKESLKFFVTDHNKEYKTPIWHEMEKSDLIFRCELMWRGINEIRKADAMAAYCTNGAILAEEILQGKYNPWY
jgi:hypothetical protein